MLHLWYTFVTVFSSATMNILVPDCEFKYSEQQIIGDERFIEKVEKRTENVEKRAKKISIRDLVQAIEEEIGVGLPELISRRRDERLRTARGILVALAKETGYKMVELGRILKRDISVLSRLANIGETREGAKILQKVRIRLNA